MSEKTGCVFCDFDSRHIIAESELAFAAHFDCAIKPGHIVVALKEHVESLAAMSPEQAADIMRLAARVSRAAERVAGCEKFYLVSIADAVPHYHIHLLPRMMGEAPLGPCIMGDSGWKGEVGAAVGEEEIARFVASCREALSEQRR
ncbi:MAG TPA: HIT family protein [bacterium]|nr:MAG: HIT domain protein [bacterium ADurb.Bin236]HOY63013.1 HIT family protein [bacterium]HPI75146.1 HIT family protein [bacterium]HPN94482.1 HIT family protein [bacterium]